MVRRAVVRRLDAEAVRRKPQAMPGSEIFRRTRAQEEPAATEAEMPAVLAVTHFTIGRGVRPRMIDKDISNGFRT